MPKFRSSMRTSLGLTILVMGLLGVVLSIVTGEIYRNLALDNQREALENLVKLKVDDVVQDIIHNTIELGQSIQSDSRFRQAHETKNTLEITEQLDQQFHRYFVTLTILKLEKLFSFDLDFNITGFSGEGTDKLDPDHLPCPALLEQARQRTGAQRLKLLSQMCITNGHPFLSVLIPIGGIHLKGYLLVAVDPTKNLSSAEKALGMPLTLSLPTNEIVYESPHWPSLDAMEKIIIANYDLHSSREDPIYTFSFASDVEPLHNKLENTRTLILITAGIATFLTALLALLVLQKTALNPLAMLTRQLRLVREDKTHLGELVAVTGNVEISELAEDFNNMSSELNVLYKTLENMAFTDSLTNLPNRALFYEQLEHATLLAKKDNTPFLLLMLDLDRFKYVNDTLGHHIGDQLLQEVGKRLKNIVRKSDTIARLGGDEFAAILSGANSIVAAEMLAQNIIKIINKPIHVGNRNLTVGASIGIVRCPEDGKDSHQLMQRADIAMYHAKNNHYGYTFYESELDRHSLIQLNLETDLLEAIEKNQLELHYQPKINLNSGKTMGVEVLVRWKHPKRGYIPPDAFIQLAEQTGLIQPLTRWVLNTALKQCAHWHASNLMLSIAINISARSLEDNEILSIINSALASSGVAPHWISLELTESAVMADPERAMQMLSKLHFIGLRITVDDFGTGYSSLAYLKKLPVSDIKIDKSFVLNMDNDDNDAVIVRSTIDLAHNMGLSVIAEGVERKSVLDMLMNLGCDMAQGYHMCKPLEPEELPRWLDQSHWGIKNLVTLVKQ